MEAQKRKNDAGGAELNNQVKHTTNQENLQALQSIPPYKLRIMLKQADRIYSQLMDIPQFAATYDDVEFILETVLGAVRKARGKGDVVV